jgi:hypothetical protein
VSSSNGTLKLADVRARAAAALEPAADGDPDVHMDVVDAVQPPALMLFWDDPWLEPKTISTCLWDASMVVLCIASRVEPGPGVAKLEELVAYTVARLIADTYTWPAATLQAPRVFTIGNVPLLGARIIYRVPVTL